MNTKTIAIAIALAAGTAFVSNVHAASTITTLDTVQVRPSADQIAQANVERTSSIPTLALVEVRPTAGQIAEYRNELADSRRVTTLAAVEVRPTAEQRDALAAEQNDRRTDYMGALASAAGTLARDVIINLPTLQVRPSPNDLQALALETASVLVRP
ncbi:MAG: hypothetical protein ACREPC_00960 [Stenotrophomonas sp.]|uniref:hypothetical protein n=1 Tax=Stenotrophomonas sp. TaxID=69392 RepID=UPI003D6D1B91